MYNLHFSPPDGRSMQYDCHEFAFPSQRLLAVLNVAFISKHWFVPGKIGRLEKKRFVSARPRNRLPGRKVL